MPKFPKEIYVIWDGQEGEASDRCLLAFNGQDCGEDGDKVAIYTLKEIRTKVITHTLK